MLILLLTVQIAIGMPNHLHVIVHFQNESFNINTIVAIEKDLWLMKLLTG
jgi:hypothetical protein